MASIGGRDCISVAPVARVFILVEVGAPGVLTCAGVLLAPQPLSRSASAAVRHSVRIA